MSLFSLLDVSWLRQDRLVLAGQSYFNPDSLSDEYLLGKLQAAEKDASRQLRVQLEPTEIFTDEPTQAEIDALAGKPWLEEPGYDYEQDFFQADSWGYLVLRQKPAIRIDSIKFAYPSPGNQIFQIPSDWIRLDKKYGHVRLIPATTAFAAPLSAFIMQAIGGGRTIPFMIRVRYAAGLTDAKTNHPDLIDTIYKMAVIRILEDRVPAQSESISADGLSQSMSTDLSKYKDAVKSAIGELRDEIHGIRMTVIG